MEIRSAMFGWALYIDCQFVPSYELTEQPGTASRIGDIVGYTIVGDSCAYLETHPSARLDLVFLNGPHGGP